jgi:hypothetical protein
LLPPNRLGRIVSTTLQGAVLREAFVPKKNRPVIMHCTMNAAERFCFMMAADSLATHVRGEQRWVRR